MVDLIAKDRRRNPCRERCTRSVFRRLVRTEGALGDPEISVAPKQPLPDRTSHVTTLIPISSRPRPSRAYMTWKRVPRPEKEVGVLGFGDEHDRRDWSSFGSRIAASTGCSAGKWLSATSCASVTSVKPRSRISVPTSRSLCWYRTGELKYRQTTTFSGTGAETTLFSVSTCSAALRGSVLDPRSLSAGHPFSKSTVRSPTERTATALMVQALPQSSSPSSTASSVWNSSDSCLG